MASHLLHQLHLLVPSQLILNSRHSTVRMCGKGNSYTALRMPSTRSVTELHPSPHVSFYNFIFSDYILKILIDQKYII